MTIAGLCFLVLVIALPLWALRRQAQMFPKGVERAGSAERSGQRRFRITSPWMWGGRG
jgi:hypothetical protein